jgi:hypothetical protein
MRRKVWAHVEPAFRSLARIHAKRFGVVRALRTIRQEEHVLFLAGSVLMPAPGLVERDLPVGADDDEATSASSQLLMGESRLYSLDVTGSD